MTDIRCTLDRIRAKAPLIHCISNIVSANDCANLLLAIGASPMMAMAEAEMPDIARISSAAVLNTGTPDAQRFLLCTLRGKLAMQHNQPIVLDPVGVGASRWRLEGIREMLRQVRPSIIRVNLSEARALLGLAEEERGVDSSAQASTDEAQQCAARLARRAGCTVLISGRQDWVSDGQRFSGIEGGSPWISAITGSGCMLSALCGAFAAVEPDAYCAAVQAAQFWKDCAADAQISAAGLGMGHFHMALMDAAWKRAQGHERSSPARRPQETD